MFVFLALAILYPNDRLSEFAMATNQRPLNSMRSLSVPLKVIILGDKRLVPKKSADNNIYIDTTTDHITPCCACAHGVTILISAYCEPLTC